MVETKRTPRSNKTREDSARRKPWAPPSLLKAPPPPEGYVHRWIRIAMRDVEDKTNAFSRMQEGWEPVRADEYPDFNAATIEEGRHKGIIGTGGLMLCRMPDETVNERAVYYGTRTREQMQSVDQDLMKDAHPSMPIHRDRQSRVTFGGRDSGSE